MVRIHLSPGKSQANLPTVLARPNRSHLRAHLYRYGVVFEDLLRPAKAAAFPLHDEIPKGVRGGIDETRSLRVAAIGSRLGAIKGIQRAEGIAQFACKAADCCRLLLADLIFKDVQSSSQGHCDDSVGDLVLGKQAMD